MGILRKKIKAWATVGWQGSEGIFKSNKYKKNQLNKCVLLPFFLVNSKHVNFIRIDQDFWKTKVLNQSCSWFTCWKTYLTQNLKGVFCEAISLSVHFDNINLQVWDLVGSEDVSKTNPGGFCKTFCQMGKPVDFVSKKFASLLADGQIYCRIMKYSWHFTNCEYFNISST